MANVFIHFEPKGLQEDGFPVYLKPDASEELTKMWDGAVLSNVGEGLEERTDFFPVATEGTEGSTLAHSAAYIGDLDTLKQIALDSVDDLHSMDINGWTPLHEVIEMLLHIYTFMGLF